MALRGDLASVDLAQVFQMLALNKKVGLLSIHSTKLWRVLYFDDRGVTLHHNVHSLLDKVVAAFVRSSRLTVETVDEVRDHSVRMAQPLSDSLLAGGYVEENELDYQYRLELEEEIYDLFFCREAKFEFHENTMTMEDREGTVDERFFFNCDSIIMEAARRIDEWTYISERIPSTAEVLVATAEAIDGEKFGADGPAIFDLLDGRRNVARVVEATGLSSFQVCKTLSQLLDADLIAPVAHDELVPLGNECMQEGRPQDAICLFERAIELEVGLPESHSLAAKAYQVTEEYELCIYHLECEAELRIEAGDLQGAAECLNEVRQLVPTDLQARERLVELTVGPDGVSVADFDPLLEGKELVELLIEFGDIERVRSLLERLLMVEPNDPDLKKALVNVHVRAGDQKRVAELYESIADDLVQQGKPLEAVGYLQKILLLDRSRSDISERVRRLYEFDERAGRRSRALSALAILFVLLLAGGSGYYFYNQRAAEDFAKIDVRDLVDHDDFAAAKATFDDFIREHPLTTAVSQAKAELQKIASAQALFEARRASDRASRDRELKKIRKQYKAAWARHRVEFLGGDPEIAFESVTMVRQLLTKAGDAEDVAWALEEQVERTTANIQKYLADSKRLAASYDQKLAAMDYSAARNLALRLYNEFENTKSARRIRVPVMVVTRPAGAVLLHNGKALMRTVDGKPEPVVTPGLVLCQPTQPVNLTAQLAGFEPCQIVVDCTAQAQVDVALLVVPERGIAFGAPAQTGAGVGDGWLSLGLRGGKIGLARTNGTGVQVHELGGLKAVQSDPVVEAGRVFFVTNENSIECLAVDPSISVSGWPVQLDAGAATPLRVGGGRLAVVDIHNVLHCWEQATGHRLWGVSLGNSPSGPPTFARRRVFVGTADGRVMLFDAADGRSVGILRSPSGITTAIHVDDGILFFGCADGAVRCVDFAEGRILWSQNVGRVLASTDLAVGKGGVVTAAEGRLLVLDRATGGVLAQMAVPDTVRGILIQGSRALVQMRRLRSRQEGAHDLLLAVDVATLDVLWEYAQETIGPGLPGVDDLVVALPSSSGEVVLFR